MTALVAATTRARTNPNESATRGPPGSTRFRQHEARSPSCSCSATTASRLRNARRERSARRSYTEGVSSPEPGVTSWFEAEAGAEVASSLAPRAGCAVPGASSALILANSWSTAPCAPI